MGCQSVSQSYLIGRSFNHDLSKLCVLLSALISSLLVSSTEVECCVACYIGFAAAVTTCDLFCWFPSALPCSIGCVPELSLTSSTVLRSRNKTAASQVDMAVTLRSVTLSLAYKFTD